MAKKSKTETADMFAGPENLSDPDYYICPCGSDFPEDFGKHGCPDCGGAFGAMLKSVRDFIDELPW